MAVTHISPGDQKWTVSRDLVDYRSALEIVKDAGLVRYDEHELEVDRKVRERYGWQADDFCSATAETSWSMSFGRGEWRTRTETRTRVTCTPTHFLVHAELDGFEGEQRIFSRNWDRRIPRDHV
jgi:hypothetical protein